MILLLVIIGLVALYLIFYPPFGDSNPANTTYTPGTSYTPPASSPSTGTTVKPPYNTQTPSVPSGQPNPYY